MTAPASKLSGFKPGRYSGFVNPEEPAILGLLHRDGSAWENTGGMPDRPMLSDCLSLMGGFRYIDRAGMQPDIPAVIRTASGNCLGLCLTLTALLRARGASEDEVFILLGSPRGFHMTLLHAWVLFIDRAAGPFLIDPAALNRPQAVPRTLLADHCFYAAFNDRLQASGASEVEQLLRQAGVFHSTPLIPPAPAAPTRRAAS